MNIYTKEIVVMAVIKKTLFAENLDRYQTFVTDTNPTSDYFKITELTDTFTGGKNAFLIQGSDYLVPDTLIKIEIKDSKGNIIYHEPGEGIVSSSVNGTEVVTEYYEGVSKVVAVYIYPDTSFGPATITILGELSTYNSNGLNSPIPLEWEGKYNVKWQKQINVNPSLANTTKIRFYRRPVATITETLSPIYTIVSGSKVESNIVSSFANITISKLDTFAGDVKRIRVYRTSEGDISDYDMIQDILLESKELLTSYNLTGSVITEAGLMTSEVLEKLWSYPTLTTQLTSSRIDNGVKLNGNGYFTYTSSLHLSANSVYEFGIDAFYSASTNSDMGIYVSGSNNGEVLIGTLNGVSPTKNLNDTVIEFRLPLDEPTASLYLSQSQSEWHIGNLSLKLTEDTAFSPSEISFVTSMPTVVGNETYNFKFEFYDVNNNYVPVLVTQSALFTGGNNNIGGTLIFISASASSSLAQLNAVSSSISGTAALYSSSADTTITTLSGSVDTTIVTLSGSVDTTIVTLSGSVSGSITNLSGSVSASITSLSASVSQSVYQGLLTSFARVQNLADGNYSGSFIGDNVIYSPVLGAQLGYFSTLFKVGQSPNSIYLDARQTPRKIFIGGSAPGGGDTEMSGAYNNTNTSVYLDSSGKFSLKDKLSFDGNTLTVNGTINVTGGNAATQTFASGIGSNAVSSGSLFAANAAASASISASSAQTFASAQALSAQQTAINVSAISASNAALSASAAFTNAKAVADSIANGSYSGGTLISANSIVSPIIAGANGYISNVFKVGDGGITLDGTNKTIYIGTGAYANTNTGFYVSSTGAFSLKDKLTWDGTTLSINGNITVSGGNAATTTQVGAAQTTADNAATAASNAQTTANSKLGAGQAAADVNSNTTTISGGKIRTGIIESTGYSYSSGDYSTTGTQINLDIVLIRSKNFAITSAGDALFKGSIAIGSGNSIFKADTNGIYLGNATFASAPFSVTPGGSLSATNANLTGNITATGGTLGGWVIDGAILRDAASRLQLNPGSPSLDIFDTGGAKRLTVKFGAMTSPFSGASIYIDPPSALINPVTNSYGVGFHREIIRSSNYNEFYVAEAGTYFAQSYTSSDIYGVIQTFFGFQGYAAAAVRSVITDTSGNEVAYIGGVYGDTSSDNDYVNLTGYNSGVYVSFPAAGTYRIYSQFSYDMYIQQGIVYINTVSVDDPAVNVGIQLNIAEVTTDGFQVISSVDSYCTIRRGGTYSIDTKGSLNVQAPSGNFIYLNGLVHPWVGNTNDLGTSGNRWKTIWLNTQPQVGSDVRIKNSIVESDLGLDFVNSLNPVKYKLNASTTPRYHYGLIAQEVTSSLQTYGLTSNDVGFITSASFHYS